jgi:hypothetical protein
MVARSSKLEHAALRMASVSGIPPGPTWPHAQSTNLPGFGGWHHCPPEERAEVFIGLDRTMEAILAGLPAAERRRRRDAARLLDPRPTPWWKNLRRSAWPREPWADEDATS